MKTDLQKLINNPVKFLQSEAGFPIPETEKPIVFTWWEALVMEAVFKARQKIRIIADIKKSLKTTKAACIGYYTALKNPYAEIYIISNDLEQSKSRVFNYIARSVELNHYVSAKKTHNELLFSNGARIKALPCDFKGEAGANPLLTIFDEPWGFTSESSQRMVEEFACPPNLEDSFQVFTGYAGFEGESLFWLNLYNQGIKGKRIHKKLPLYETPEIIMYWSHGPRHGHPGHEWHTPEYFRTQKATLRPFQFIRLFENKWVSGGESFIAREVWDACTDSDYKTPLPNKKHQLYIGVDSATKSDYAAVMSVFTDESRVYLGPYRIWKPSKSEPLDIDLTVKPYLEFLHSNYRVKTIQVDPYQMHNAITDLTKSGLPIEEFPQTSGNLTQATQDLYDLLTQRNITLTTDKELAEQSQNAVAVESPRGVKLSKEKSGNKIDAIVALSFACLFAVEGMHKPAPVDIGLNLSEPYRKRDIDDIYRDMQKRQRKSLIWS